MQCFINFMIFQMCLRFARSLDQESLNVTPVLSPKAFRSYYIRQVLCQTTSCRKCEKVMVVQFYKRDRQQKVSSSCFLKGCFCRSSGRKSPGTPLIILLSYARLYYRWTIAAGIPLTITLVLFSNKSYHVDNNW